MSNLESFERPQADILRARLREPRRRIQFVSGPRQVGKTTLVRQVLQSQAASSYASADEPTLRDSTWLQVVWDGARQQARSVTPGGAILVVDEIQKVVGWSEAVKRLWDEDTLGGVPLHVVLLGSAPLLMQQGVTESLAGRFETIHLGHWSFAEMREAFGLTLEQYLYFGGYPGAAHLIEDVPRWRRYILDAMIEPTIARDVLLLERVQKPALLRRLFDLGCRYSGQELSYTKMLGQLQDKGNTVTLAHYLELLSAAGMLRGLQKFAGAEVRQRGSSPKLQVYNNALMTAQLGITPEELAADAELRGRVVESAVGAHLANAAATGECELFYWRRGDREVDFVVRIGRRVVAIEVKSGSAPADLRGLEAFRKEFGADATLLVGGEGVRLEHFLTSPITQWLQVTG